MAAEGTQIEGEAEGGALNPQIAEKKQEEKARSKGWKPLEEFHGDAADWVPAKEFLGREKLFDKIHDLKNQLSRQASKFEQDMSRISQHFSKVRETEYKRAKKELESQLAVAKSEGNVDEVADLAGQIKEVETEAKEAALEAKVAQQAVRQGGPTPEFVEWQKENPWFEKDAEMTADAIAIGTGYAAAKGPTVSQKEVLEYTTKKIKRLYAEKFEDESKGKRVSEDKVEGGSPSRPTSRKGKLSTSDLDEVERSVMRTLIKRGVLKDAAKKNNRTQEEEYLAQLQERKAAA